MKLCICYTALAVLSIAFLNAQPPNNVFSVKDDIEMVRFNDPSESGKNAAAKFSPNGRYFVVVTSRGLIKSDETESSLSIFSANETRAFLASPKLFTVPRPRFIIKMKAVLSHAQDDVYGSVITELRWSPDSRKLYFIAETHRRDLRLYEIDLKYGRAVPLTPEGYSVARFDFSTEAIVYSAWRTREDDATPEDMKNHEINADARDVTGESLRHILFPNSQPHPTKRNLWIVRRGNSSSATKPIPMLPERDISWLPEAFALSPKADMLVHLQPITKVSEGWRLYEPAKGFEHMRVDSQNADITAPDNLWRLKEYALVNLANGTSRPLIGAPQAFALAYGANSSAVWSSDERHLLLTDTFLPLNNINEPERTKRLEPCAVAAIEVLTLEAHCVVFRVEVNRGETGNPLIGKPSFGKTDAEVLLIVRSPNATAEQRRYLFNKGAWRLASTTALIEHSAQLGSDEDAASQPLTVAIRQSLNQPPTLWATNNRTGRSEMIWNPNPQLANLQFGEASIYRWKDRTGREWNGGLVKPVDYAPGQRYPLVIQIYNFDGSQFLTDGMMPTAFAARALASAGIAVLQIQRRMPHSFNEEEAQTHIEAFRSAIENLAEAGLIDPEKVGLVGFSASAWYVENAIAREPKRFTAATIAEGIDISYMQYRLLGVSDPPLAEEFEKIIGTKPVGDGLAQWYRLAPGFNLDRVIAPLRIEAMEPTSVLGEWELYSSLRAQGKPVDLIYFPEGQHVHQRPLERFASQQGSVDWFRFWLQGYEDPDPSKRAQYTMWERMRNGHRLY